MRFASGIFSAPIFPRATFSSSSLGFCLSNFVQQISASCVFYVEESCFEMVIFYQCTQGDPNYHLLEFEIKKLFLRRSGRSYFVEKYRKQNYSMSRLGYYRKYFACMKRDNMYVSYRTHSFENDGPLRLKPKSLGTMYTGVR